MFSLRRSTLLYLDLLCKRINDLIFVVNYIFGALFLQLKLGYEQFGGGICDRDPWNRLICFLETCDECLSQDPLFAD